MSGRKQHIPQSLLRGFGKQGKGKAVQVTVYSGDRGVFTTATDGVAARRYFYSQLPGDLGVQTLDDRITTFETRLAMSLAEFRGVVPGHEVDARKAAEAVAHLCARQAHLRDSFASGAGDLLRGTVKLFLDKERTRKALGLDAFTPDERVRDAIHKIYDKYDAQLNQKGFTKTKFERLMFDQMKINYDDRIFPELSSFLQIFSAQVQGQTDRFAREGHNKALERGLAPQTRLEILERFVWRTEPAPVTGLVLPDCVAMSWTAGAGYQPLMFAGKDIDAVFMPLCHDRLLVGHRATTCNVPEMINEVAVICSWDCFIARDRTPEFQRLVPRIGERARKLIDEAVQAGLEQRK